ncbi:MAG: type II toxin-antitoxin system HigB family toxin [Anaerolineales bacterium]|nr:type II toxin-antitoxin system HigB family toxin [Anaerolineales bacterium]
MVGANIKGNHYRLIVKITLTLESSIFVSSVPSS